ncbi:amyloid-beta A4 precursor protein-binding family A member 3-like [Ictidomys tridecemlineatus]
MGLPASLFTAPWQHWAAAGVGRPPSLGWLVGEWGRGPCRRSEDPVARGGTAPGGAGAQQAPAPGASDPHGDFLTPRPRSEPPAMDLEKPKDTLVPSEDLNTESQWDAVPEALGSLSPVDLEGSSVQGLVQQLEALPGDLMGLPPDSAPCPLHIATGQGLDPHDTTDAHGLVSCLLRLVGMIF